MRPIDEFILRQRLYGLYFFKKIYPISREATSSLHTNTIIHNFKDTYPISHHQMHSMLLRCCLHVRDEAGNVEWVENVAVTIHTCPMHYIMIKLASHLAI